MTEPYTTLARSARESQQPANAFWTRGTLYLAVGVGVVLIGLVAAGLVPVAALVGLPLVLFLPGYAFTSTLLRDEATGFAERLLFSLGLSLAMSMLGGFVLNWT
ncbi:MAG: DUF1616 domain-containing protein, partial [Chloroflexota bacterium]|nr:DUF1616 domain-containing protein [Chloroflexota bacterium]